jgi:hypothetical protein
MPLTSTLQDKKPIQIDEIKKPPGKRNFFEKLSAILQKLLECPKFLLCPWHLLLAQMHPPPPPLHIFILHIEEIVFKPYSEKQIASQIDQPFLSPKDSSSFAVERSSLHLPIRGNMV